MHAKGIFILGAFLFTLHLLSAQRLQEGLSIGVPVMGYFDPLDIYYNRSSSSQALFEDVFQLAPAYSLTYAFRAKGRKQSFIKHSAFITPYHYGENLWEFSSYFIRLGFGRTHYLPFAPAWQWQWELGGQVDRLWRERSVYDPLDLYAKWRKPLPYASLNLQTTALGKHLIAGVGVELAARGNEGSLIENAYLVANLAWALKAREQNPEYEPPKLDDRQKRIYLGYQQARYGSWDQYAEEDYLLDMRSIVGEYWWRLQKQWRLASRLSFGFGATGMGPEIGIQYDWLIHAEQNVYLRIGEHFSILPFGGLGILAGQIWQEDYQGNRRLSTRKNLFRPYLKSGFRLQAPHHRVFAEFSISTIPNFQAGLGVRLGR